MTTTIKTNTLPALRTLESLCLGMHQLIVIEETAFNLIAYTREMHESHMLLIDADLDVYYLAVITAMVNHPKRGISGPMAEKIYRHLRVMQDLVKQGRV